MSFGFSVGDFVLLVQLAHRTFRNCQQAGTEYLEIASEVRCLHSVLRILRAEAQKPESKIFRQDPVATAQLIEAADGCKTVLSSLDVLLSKYDALKDNQAGAGKKLRQRLGFGSKIAELGVVRGKLIAYTSTLSVLIDTMQLQSAERIETKVDGGFADVKREMKTQFELLRSEIYTIASQKRAEERMGATVSSLSLSTYAGDEKTAWQDFRRELIGKGFRSESLERYKDLLQAYMMKLDQSGVLDQDQDSVLPSLGSTPWWAKRMYLETVNSLADLELTNDVPSKPILPPVIEEKDFGELADGDGVKALDESGFVPQTPEESSLDLRMIVPDFEKIVIVHSVETSEIEQPLSGNTVDSNEGYLPQSSMPTESDTGKALPTSLPSDGMKTTTATMTKKRRPRATKGISEQWLNIQRIPKIQGLDYSTELRSTEEQTYTTAKTLHLQPSLGDEDESLYEIDADGELQKLGQEGAAVVHESSSVMELAPEPMSNLSIGDHLEAPTGTSKSSRRIKDSTVVGSRPQSYPTPSVAPQDPRSGFKNNSKLPKSPVNLATEGLATLKIEARQHTRARESLANTGSSGSTVESDPTTLNRASPIGKKVRHAITPPIVILDPPDNPSPRTQPPNRGILKRPTESFPEDPNSPREGAAPIKDAKTDKNIPRDARWTKLSRDLVTPEALRAGKERFEMTPDSIIVLRVLSREEIKGYVEATKMIREARDMPRNPQSRNPSAPDFIAERSPWTNERFDRRYPLYGTEKRRKPKVNTGATSTSFAETALVAAALFQIYQSKKKRKGQDRPARPESPISDAKLQLNKRRDSMLRGTALHEKGPNRSQYHEREYYYSSSEIESDNDSVKSASSADSFDRLSQSRSDKMTGHDEKDAQSHPTMPNTRHDYEKTQNPDSSHTRSQHATISSTLDGFRSSLPSGDRASTPYAARGGEKFNPFENARPGTDSPPAAETRVSTPYATHGGEKFNPFDGFKP